MKNLIAPVVAIILFVIMVVATLIYDATLCAIIGWVFVVLLAINIIQTRKMYEEFKHEVVEFQKDMLVDDLKQVFKSMEHKTPKQESKNGAKPAKPRGRKPKNIGFDEMEVKLKENKK